jgi:hypothetical protein
VWFRRFAETNFVFFIPFGKAFAMRLVPLTMSILLCAAAAFAGDIREYDLKTIERLGNELTRVSQTRDKGATIPVRKRAVQTAKVALQGKLFNIRYEYVVLDDPDGRGFPVYALGVGARPSDTVVHGHFRVTVSPDGSKAERVDALANSIFVDTKESPVVGNYKKVAFSMNQPLGTRPVETLVYASNHMKMPIAVATPPHGHVWFIDNSKTTKEAPKRQLGETR